MMPQKDSNEVNVRFDPSGNPESLFRQELRDILGLDWSARNYKILAEVRRLKALERESGDL